MDVFNDFGDVSQIATAPLVLLPAALEITEQHRRDRGALLLRRLGAGSERRKLSRAATAELLSLLFDGVVGVREGRRVRSGVEALRVLGVNGWLASPPTTLALTAQGIGYGAHLLPMPIDDLTSRLYRYGTRPATPRLVARFPSSEAVCDALGVDRLSAARAEDRRRWILSRSGESPRSAGWITWTPTTGARSATGPIYKLYVSPDLDALPDALPAVARAAFSSAAVALKVGADLRGLLRPDSLVVYFRRRSALIDVAARLGQELRGYESHGVPFTAPVDEAGLLSWGVDLPPNALGQSQSWRARVVRCLARSLVVAHASSSDPTIVLPFALARLALEGIDPATMSPAPVTRGQAA